MCITNTGKCIIFLLKLEIRNVQKRFVLKSNDDVDSINIQVARAMLVKLKATMCSDI